jgi:hypothetical protein
MQCVRDVSFHSRDGYDTEGTDSRKMTAWVSGSVRRVRRHRRSDFVPPTKSFVQRSAREAILRRKTCASRHGGMKYKVIDVECLLMGRVFAWNKNPLSQ